jgi:hypothetical protein
MQPQAKNRLFSAKKQSLPPEKSMGKKPAPQSPLPGKAASDIQSPGPENPITRPFPPRALKKNLPKLPKKPGSKNLSSGFQEKRNYGKEIPATEKPEVANELKTEDLEYEQTMPIQEPTQGPEETLNLTEDTHEDIQQLSEHQRKFESKERGSASGSGEGSMFQKENSPASRPSDSAETAKDVNGRTVSARSQGTYDVQDGIPGLAKRFKSDGGDLATRLEEKVPNHPTKLSDLEGLELIGKRQILDDYGKAVATIVEGEPSDLVGQVVGADGEILDEDGDLIGRIELISEETPKEADAVKEAVAMDHLPSLQDLTNLPIGKDGAVKDKYGRLLGHLIEGDPDDLLGETANENGEVLDEDGDLIGRVELTSLIQVKEKSDEAEHTGAESLSSAAMLQDRETSKGSKTLNDEGHHLGRVLEGQSAKTLSEKVPDELGEILDSTGEVIEQVHPVPEKAANVSMQEFEQKTVPSGREDGSTEDGPEEENSDMNAPKKTSQELPDISTLEGLKCNKFGNIVDKEGYPVGELIEGNPKELSQGGLKLDKRGQFCDNRGNILGVAQVVRNKDEGPFAEFDDLVVIEDGWVADATGARVGQVVDGEVKQLLGRAVDDNGDILDKRGNPIGHAEPWQELEPELEPEEEVDLSTLNGLFPNKLGFVTGPGGVPVLRVMGGDLKKLVGGIIDDKGQLWNDDGDIIGRIEPMSEDERKTPRLFSDLGNLAAKEDGLVKNEYGNVVGRLIDGNPRQLKGKAVDDDGDVMDNRGNVTGHAEPYTPCEECEQPERDLSELEGMTVNEFGEVVDETGAVARRLISGNPKRLNGKKVDGECQLWGDDGIVLGKAELVPVDEREKPEGLSYGLDGLTATKDGSVTNATGEVVGRLIEWDPSKLAGRAVNENGAIVDKVGNSIDRAERWISEEKPRDRNLMRGQKVNRNGEVRDEDGKLMGRFTVGNIKALVDNTVHENGKLIDSNGNKIGECTLEDNLPEPDEPEELEEPENLPEEAEKWVKEDHDRDLVKKISSVVQKTLESVEPLCKQITEVSHSYYILNVDRRLLT